MEQYVRFNNVWSDFKDIISWVPQGSIVVPMLFNALLDDVFFCIRKTPVHNFAHDNTLSSPLDETHLDEAKGLI